MKSFFKILAVLTVSVLLFASAENKGHAQSLGESVFYVDIVTFNAVGEYSHQFQDYFIFRNGTFGTALFDKNSKAIQQRTFSEAPDCLLNGCLGLDPDPNKGSVNYAWLADLIKTTCEPDCTWNFKGNRIGPAMGGRITSSLGDHFLFFGLKIETNASSSLPAFVDGDVEMLYTTALSRQTAQSLR